MIDHNKAELIEVWDFVHNLKCIFRLCKDESSSLSNLRRVERKNLLSIPCGIAEILARAASAKLFVLINQLREKSVNINHLCRKQK